MAKTNKFTDFIVEIILPIIAALLTIVALFFMWVLFCIILNDAKMAKRAESIFYFDKKTYYIDSYEYSGDQIIAIGVNGKKIVFPKDNTVIEDK